MKDLLFAVGLFLDKQFDKIILIVILFATIFRADDAATLAKDIAMQAFAALLGFMHGRRVGEDNAKQIG